MSDNTVTSADIRQSVSISIKLMSGDLIALEIDSGITCSEFHQIAVTFLDVTFLDKQKPLGSDCMSFMPVTLIRMAKADDDVDGSEIKYNDELLTPVPEEIFFAFIDNISYSVNYHLTSTEVVDLNNDYRYDMYQVTLYQHNQCDGQKETTFTTQAIYLAENPLRFFLESDKIPAQCYGRYQDEWKIFIPQEMSAFQSLADLVDHSPLGENLSSRAKERVKTLLVDQYIWIF